MTDPADFPFAETMQTEAERPAGPGGWSPDRAHARIRLLAGATGLAGVALILVLLLNGAHSHG